MGQALLNFFLPLFHCGDPDGAVASTRNILDCALAPEAARLMARAATRLSDKVLKDFISIPLSYDDPDCTVLC